jgi:hypothetical protein
LGDQIKKNDVGRACSTCGKRRDTVYTRFWWGDLRERDHLEDRRGWQDNIKTDLKK